MERMSTFLIALLLASSVMACGRDAEADGDGAQQEFLAVSVEPTEEQTEIQTAGQSETEESNMLKNEAGSTMRLLVGEKELSVNWEENESVDALSELVGGQPLSIQMSMYGGFEQVGAIGTSLPRNDVQTTTSTGDIVLYSGNQIVMFYGSNSWAYTRLGKVTDMSADEMTELLGNGDVTITLTRTSEKESD